MTVYHKSILPLKLLNNHYTPVSVPRWRLFRSLGKILAIQKSLGRIVWKIIFSGECPSHYQKRPGKVNFFKKSGISTEESFFQYFFLKFFIIFRVKRFHPFLTREWYFASSIFQGIRLGGFNQGTETGVYHYLQERFNFAVKVGNRLCNFTCLYISVYDSYIYW